jgi:hypothetical protein
LQERDEEKAKRIMAEEIRRLNFPKVDFEQSSKSDTRKVSIARRLRTETSVSLRWIAEQLQMGSVPHLAKPIRKG